MILPCALVLPCVFLSTLGKNYVCCVPVNLHTANYGAHGKIEVSGSDWCCGRFDVSISKNFFDLSLKQYDVCFRIYTNQDDLFVCLFIASRRNARARNQCACRASKMMPKVTENCIDSTHRLIHRFQVQQSDAPLKLWT